MDWKTRLPASMKSKIDIDAAKMEIQKQYQQNLAAGFPLRVAGSITRKKIMAMMVKKGVPNNDAAFFIHVCEALPYSGCGCCEYRK